MNESFNYLVQPTCTSLFEIIDKQFKLKLINTSVWTPLPVFVGDDPPLHLLVVLSDANSKPGAQLPVVEGVHHTKHLSLVETQPIRRFLLVLKVRPDVEGVTDI